MSDSDVVRASILPTTHGIFTRNPQNLMLEEDLPKLPAISYLFKMPCTCTTKSSQSFPPQNLTSIHPFWFRRGRRCGHLNFGGCHGAISDPRKIFAPEELRKSHGSDNQLDGFMPFPSGADCKDVDMMMFSLFQAWFFSGLRKMWNHWPRHHPLDARVAGVCSPASSPSDPSGPWDRSADRSADRWLDLPWDPWCPERHERPGTIWYMTYGCCALGYNGNHCQYLSVDTHKGFCSGPRASLIKPYYTIPFDHLQSLQDVNFPGTLCPGTWWPTSSQLPPPSHWRLPRSSATSSPRP